MKNKDNAFTKAFENPKQMCQDYPNWMSIFYSYEKAKHNPEWMARHNNWY